MSSCNASRFDQEAALEQWKETQTGPLAQSIPTNLINWVRLSPDIFHAGLLDPTGGPDSPHIEMVYLGVSSNSNSVTAPAESTPQVSSGA